MAPKSRLDALAGLPSDSDDDSSGGASGSDGDDAHAAAAAQPAAKKAKTLTIEDLQRAGYREGPSVLFIKPPADEGPLGLSVSDGRSHKRDEGEDTAEERRATAHAASRGAEEAAAYAAAAVAHAERLRAEARAEKEKLVKDKRLSFNQKEKRKREAGMASSGANYVEEEKRIARQFGHYSGFD
jgi:hypothetical protein